MYGLNRKVDFNDARKIKGQSKMVNMTISNSTIYVSILRFYDENDRLISEMISHQIGEHFLDDEENWTVENLKEGEKIVGIKVL